MPEVVDNGFLYIAQPPLLKVGKGKSEIYLKEERELNDHLLKRVCDKKIIKMGKNGKEIADHKLFIFMGDLSEYLIIINTLEKRGFPQDLIEALIKMDVKDKRFLQDRIKMEDLRNALAAKGYECTELNWNDERNLFELKVLPPRETDTATDEQADPIKIGSGLVFSTNFQQCVVLAGKIFPYDDPPFGIFEKEENSGQVKAESKNELFKYMMEEGKKGIVIQRYKGLGEMNPEQLWKTTMDPETRTLLQVKVEDAVETDEIFTVLMGDEVEPRREFIQNNALEVSTLDI